MADCWSARIAEHYRCGLSPELTDWFDSGIWKTAGHNEFRQPIHPQNLIDHAPEAIWPGMMGCDCLPIVSNTAGDWLCVRVGSDNVAAQIIHWYHGGGDWIPWGRNLPEAIMFDSVAQRFPSQARRHAVPAEPPRPESSEPGPASDPILLWALGHLPSEMGSVALTDRSCEETAQLMLEHRAAEVAVRCELAVSALLEPTPNWESAAQHAAPITQLAPQLAWAWEIAGYAAELDQDLDAAKAAYLRAANCSVFSDQSIRLATRWSPRQAAKFAVARLSELDGSLVAASDYLQLLCIADEHHRRDAVTRYWLAEGQRLMSASNATAVYDAFVAAGWDIGASPISSYRNILGSVISAAQANGQTGRAEIARVHLRCLNDRYAE